MTLFDSECLSVPVTTVKIVDSPLTLILRWCSSSNRLTCWLTADLPHDIRGPHHRRACQSSLATRPTADWIQNRRTDVQSCTWECAAIPGSSGSGRRSTRPSGTAFCRHLQSPVGASVRLSTVGSWAFPVAGPRIWNALPQETTSAQSLSLFRQRLKSHLFRQSYPDLDFWCFTVRLMLLLRV